MIFNILGRFYDPIKNFAPKLPALAIGIIVGIIIISVVAAIIKNVLKVARVPKALSQILLSLLMIVMWILLLAEIARGAGLSSVALAISGSLIVLGLALANGATTLVSDIISGVFLAKDEDFEIGYKVKTGDIEGIIQKIDIRKVRIIDDKDQLHVVPNANLDKNGWTILEREPEDDKITKKHFVFRKNIDQK